MVIKNEFLFIFMIIVWIILLSMRFYVLFKQVTYNKSLIGKIGTIYMSFDDNIYLARLDSMPDDKVIVKSVDNMKPGDRFKIINEHDNYPTIKKIDVI